MGAIYLITGIMASGKSTVGQMLATRFDRGVHVRGDIYRKMVVSGREEMSTQPTDEALRQLNLRYDLSTHAAQQYHTAGFDVVLQDVMIGSVLPGIIARIDARPLYVVVLCPAPGIVAEREIGRGKTGYSHGFTPENMHALMLAETPRVGLWLDTSYMTAAEAVDAIVHRTGRGEGFIP